MNLNSIMAVELCAEDRARLDRFTEALERRCAQVDFIIKKDEDGAAPVVAVPAAKEEAPSWPESTPFPEPVKAQPEPEPVKPSVTLEQIQKKATQIAAGSAEKKAALRGIVNRYAAKVTDLPADCWGAVWAELCKLESEA